MVIQFTLQEMMVFLACLLALLAIVVGILLIPILVHVKKVGGIIRHIVESNEAGIKKTLAAVPGIVENADHITSDLKETTALLNEAAPGIVEDVQSATSSVRESIESAGEVVGGLTTTLGSFVRDKEEAPIGFMTFIPLITEVVQVIVRAFTNKDEA